MIVDPAKRSEDPISRSDVHILREILAAESAMESGKDLPRFAGPRRPTDLKKESGERFPCMEIGSHMESGELPRLIEAKRSLERSKDRSVSGEWKRFPAEETEKWRDAWDRSDDWRFPFVHHQVLKIREEDLHLGEDLGEGLSAKDKIAFLHLRSQVDALFYSRPILRSSPLGNKTAIESVQ
ncbi:uncharacterized protein LOC131231693 [Magnolia sinica]|uniref:uncharacterized protein LOC131231693 n=1 Tax=Magnolia sinica TaxID=86752 RepID=UPI0026585552|nr:uncharacterized protein LOC131231693 [Magnolia sinica]